MIAGMKKLTLAATTGDIDRLVRELVWLESVEVVEQAPDAELPPGFYACDNAQNTAALERDRTRLAAASETLAPFGSGKKGKMLPEALTRAEFEALDADVENALALAARVEDLTKDRAAFKAKIAKAENEIASLAPFLLYPQPIALNETRKTVIFKGTFPKVLTKDAIFQKLAAS